jgi:adenine deaminase
MPTYRASYATTEILKELIDVSLGRKKAECVIKNGYILDVFSGRFILGDMAIHRGMIAGVFDHYHGEKEVDVKGAYLVPGFIDAHVHLESSLLVPHQYQQLVLPSGTTTVIWDLHEIANVSGAKGISWALAAIEHLILDVFVMLSSCVPATSPDLQFETSGAHLKVDDLKAFMHHPRVLGLAELMNLPGLFGLDEDVLAKVMAFNRCSRDGHCPQTTAHPLNACGVAGIGSCHETISPEEAFEKLSKGISVLIREGSCARNADALLPLLNEYTSSTMCFCSDDLKPNDLVKDGHINFIINKALKKGIKPEVVFRAASFAPAHLYHLQDRGALAPGYLADFCVVAPEHTDWREGMTIQAVYKSGRCVDATQLSKPVRSLISEPANTMNLSPCTVNDFDILTKSSASRSSWQKVWVIGVLESQIITDKLAMDVPVAGGKLGMDLENDILKIAVFERHLRSGNRTIGFVKGFQLKQGALASTVAHDSHNLIVIGTDEKLMMQAVNRLIEVGGGLIAVDGACREVVLPLPIGGLMTSAKTSEVLSILEAQKAMMKGMGCRLKEPFLQMAFLALPVIPSLKITDRGIIDVDAFKKIDLIA